MAVVTRRSYAKATAPALFVLSLLLRLNIASRTNPAAETNGSWLTCLSLPQVHQKKKNQVRFKTYRVWRQSIYRADAQLS
ncbi:hypothetical protein F4825DRAFT_47844 [Nemania diffusa]|nr:hypothetical protein F4825DRAFT_47844 [Nemania diffusa]